MDGLVRLPARRLAALIAARAVSSTELVNACVARIEEVNPTVNAVVETRFDAARQEAATADRALAHGGVRGPLHGVPCTVKEAVAVGGMHWTNGVAADDRSGR